MRVNYTEFVLNNYSERIVKGLYKIDDFKNIRLFSCKNDKLHDILLKFSDKITHIWEDFENNRKKFYISLYDFDFKKSLQIISEMKKILWISKKYFLEKNFLKFDCIGIDILENWGMNLKIYEIIKNNSFEWLPDFIDHKNIKETWYLKDFSGRKKKFFRFSTYENIENFKYEFNVSNIKYNENILWKVKYFCIEWEKKEIYFL